MAVQHRWTAYRQLKDHGSERLPGSVHPIAPFNRDPAMAAAHAFDRVTGASVPITRLQTYGEALAQYHLHPESKFLQGDYGDRGLTERRHIIAETVELIGKEANRWEEQVYLGENPEAQIVYGTAPEDQAHFRERVKAACQPYAYAVLADRTSLAPTTIMRMLTGPTKGSPASWQRLWTAVRSLDALGQGLDEPSPDG